MEALDKVIAATDEVLACPFHATAFTSGAGTVWRCGRGVGELEGGAPARISSRHRTYLSEPQFFLHRGTYLARSRG